MHPFAPELIAAANGVAVSPDGTSIYAVSYQGGTVATFARGPDGSLTYAGCFADHGRHGCTEPGHSSLAHAYNVAVSPEGTSVYVTTQDEESAVTVFDRAPDGQLAYDQCFANQGTYGCESPPHDSLRDLGGVAVSPNGTSVYVVGGIDTNAITSFDRAADGQLTYAGCIASNYYVTDRVHGCTRMKRQSLADPAGVVVSPDGKSVYVGSLEEPVLNRFDRDSDGHLTYQGCIANGGARGCARSPIGSLAGDDALALSPDGRSLYTASFDNAAITRFDRSSDGAIHWRDCFSSRDYEVARGCRRAPSGSLEAGVSIAVSQDGRRVYYGASRPASTAGPAPLPSLTEARTDGSRPATATSATGAIAVAGCHLAFVEADGLALSSDGASLYIAGRSRWRSSRSASPDQHPP